MNTPQGAVPATVCARCGEPIIATVATGEGLDVAIEARDVDGDVVLVQGVSGWTARVLLWPHERAAADPALRRRRHWCVRRYRCSGNAGTCQQRARLYALGTWCDDCVPGHGAGGGDRR